MVDFLVFLYFFLGTVFFTYPLIFYLTTKISGLYDELLITWIINWVIHALTTNPFFLFQANIFYPYKNTLAYSDIHLTNALLTLPFVKIFKEPLLAFNINLLTGFVFTGFFTYLLVKYLTKDWLAGLISGTLLTFSTIHLNYLGHLQLFCLQYFIFSLYFLFKYLEKRKIKFFWLLILFSVLTTLNNFLVGYFLVFSTLIITFFNHEFRARINGFLFRLTSPGRSRFAIPSRWPEGLLEGESGKIVRNSCNKRFRDFLIWLSFLTFIILPFLWPYFSVSREFKYQRSIKEAIHFSLQPEDLIYPSSLTKLEQPLIKVFNLEAKESWMKTTPGYLGLSLTILGLVSFIYFLLKKKAKHLFLVFFLIGLTGFILAFGPAMHWGRKTIHYPFIIPLPYAVLYYLLPGFKGFRTPSRFILLSAFALSVIIGLSFSQFSKNWSRRLKLMFVLVSCLLVFWEFNFPLPLYNVSAKKDFIGVSSFLSEKGGNQPVLYLPILNWDAYENIKIETERQFHSTLTFQPMVNGYSGFTPPEREILMKKIMLEFPSQELIDWLKKIKVKYLVIQEKAYQEVETKKFTVNGQKIKSFKTVIGELKKYKKDLFIVKEIDKDLIYEIR